MPTYQRPLSGELKMVCHISSAGRLTCYVLHLPSQFSSFGNRLLTKFELVVTDDELLDGDWGQVLIRAAQGAAAGL